MIERLVPAGPHHRVRVRCTERVDGDFRVDGSGGPLDRRRRAVSPGPWTWLRQVHGDTVVDVRHVGEGAGAEADGSVTAVAGAVLAIQTADCAPVVLVGDGVLAVIHAGWRGIVAGVLPRGIDAVHRLGGGPVHALLGPCIAPAGYEFGSEDLDAVVAIVGESARGHTADGTTALDLGAAVEAQCRAHGVAAFDRISTGHAARSMDTADPRWFSHRTRGDSGRQSTVAWLEPA